MKRRPSGIFRIKIEPGKSRKGVRKIIEEGKAAFKANRNMIQMEFVMQSKTMLMPIFLLMTATKSSLVI